jgi:hypothetical protein
MRGENFNARQTPDFTSPKDSAQRVPRKSIKLESLMAFLANYHSIKLHNESIPWKLLALWGSFSHFQEASPRRFSYF